MRFKKEHAKFFLDPLAKSAPSLEASQKVDLVLSPALYWVKKVKLPVKKSRDVKRLLPSLFEDLLPEGNYSYHAYKSGEEYLIFAYEEQRILELLFKFGIAFAQIGSVHFAQSLGAFLETPRRINETQALLLKDDLVIIAPLAWVDAQEELEMDGVRLSNNTIRLQQYGHIVDSSSVNKISIALLLLAFVVGAEIFVTHMKKAEVLSKKEELFTQYKLQATMMQNRSLLAGYLSTSKEQKALREAFGAFLSLKLQRQCRIKRMEYKAKILKVTISEVTPQSQRAITSQLQNKGVVFTPKLFKTNLTLEVKI